MAKAQSSSCSVDLVGLAETWHVSSPKIRWKKLPHSPPGLLPRVTDCKTRCSQVSMHQCELAVSITGLCTKKFGRQRFCLDSAKETRRMSQRPHVERTNRQGSDVDSFLQRLCVGVDARPMCHAGLGHRADTPSCPRFVSCAGSLYDSKDGSEKTQLAMHRPFT